MDSHYSVKLGQLIKDFELEVLRGAPSFEDILIQKEDVNRPALQLAGFFDYFDYKRIQMIGRVEATYLAWLDLRAYGKSCDELTALFWKQGVKLSEGNFFGPEGEGFMRLNFGCPQGMIEEGLRRMARALEEE